MYDKENKDKELKSIIMKIFKDNYEKYGVPRITQELRNMGININVHSLYFVFLNCIL